MGKSNYSDELRAELDAASRRVAGELQSLNDSGATSTDDRQRAYDEWVASLPADIRARVVAETEDVRGQIETMLTTSGYRGDLGSMNLPDLANLAATRGLLTLEGTATIPTASALDAASEAAKAGGSFHLNPLTGGIWIYRDREGTVLHDYLPGGSEGPPAAVVFDEVMSDSERGGARPTAAQIDEAMRDGASSLRFGADGEVIGDFPDGSSRSYPNNPLQQGLEDLQLADGRIGDLGSALDGALTRGGEDLLRGVQGVIDGLSRTRYDTVGGSGAAAGMSGTSTAPGSGMTGGGGGGAAGTGGATTSDRPSSSGGSGSGSGSGSSWDSSIEPDDFGTVPRVSSGGSKPAGGSTTTGTGTEPAAAAENEIVDRTDGDEPVEPDDDDGYRPSTITPPTDGTYAWDQGRDDGSDDDDDDDETDSTDSSDDDDDGSTDAGYTPAPDGEGRKVPTDEEFEEIVAAAEARRTWSDGVPMKAPEWDAAFARAVQERKLAMVGNPGDPDADPGTGGGGFIPSDTLPVVPDPDDDTPGHDSDGVDNGSEDPTQHNPQIPLGPDFLDDDVEPAPALAVQEMLIAEVDHGDEQPLEVMVAAEIVRTGAPAIPGYVSTLGDPVSSMPPPEDEPASLASQGDTRLGGHLSMPATFRLPTAEDDDADDAAPG